MRAIVVATALAGCSFDHGADPGHDAAMSPGDRTPDTAGAAACLAASTHSYGGHHYFATLAGSRATCETSCEAVAGHLVKIESADENDDLATAFGLTGNTYLWIGLWDPSGTDTYVWQDGSALSTAYNGFQDMVVPGSSQNCVDSDGTWSAFSCSSANHGGICECE